MTTTGKRSKAMNEPNLIPAGRCRHCKGNEYTVVGTARHSETLDEGVVYRQDYGEHRQSVRPKGMFFETAKVDGQEVPRFQLLGSSSDGVGLNERFVRESRMSATWP